MKDEYCLQNQYYIRYPFMGIISTANIVHVRCYKLTFHFKNKINASLRVMPVYRKAIGDRGGSGKSWRVEQFWEQH